MARQSLGHMLGSVSLSPEPDAAPSTPGTTDSPVHAVPDAASKETATQSAPKRRSTSKAQPAPKRATSELDTDPIRQLDLPRKEARLTEDQLDQLSRISRQLNRARRGRGERITDNTLIRTAVDLLLAQHDQLSGTTESELRKSVGL